MISGLLFSCLSTGDSKYDYDGEMGTTVDSKQEVQGTGYKSSYYPYLILFEACAWNQATSNSVVMKKTGFKLAAIIDQ